ncbi:MAG: hypothetical protein BWY78_00072 [Alphaproteobacteria bacterium ADurb.Bin438]|nr:MAG: hypothetical protein BWY78_00072 [Alphaproteobacteria bacterium ADurb.Bin438]
MRYILKNGKSLLSELLRIFKGEKRTKIYARYVAVVHLSKRNPSKSLESILRRYLTPNCKQIIDKYWEELKDLKPKEIRTKELLKEYGINPSKKNVNKLLMMKQNHKINNMQAIEVLKIQNRIKIKLSQNKFKNRF